MSKLPASCPRCTGMIFEEIILPPESYHYGKIICAACGSHIDWLPDPKVTAAFKERKEVIDAVLDTDRVTSWERMFLSSMRDRRFLSPKQQEKYSEICSRHGLGVGVLGGLAI